MLNGTLSRRMRRWHGLNQIYGRFRNFRLLSPPRPFRAKHKLQPESCEKRWNSYYTSSRLSLEFYPNFPISNIEKQMSATQRGCRCCERINIKLCQHIKLARIFVSRHHFCVCVCGGLSLFLRLHPSALLNSPQGVSRDKLIGLIYMWTNKQLLRGGGGSVPHSLRTSQKSKAPISTAAMWNIIRRSWKCTSHMYQHQEETCKSYSVSGQIGLLE